MPKEYRTIKTPKDVGTVSVKDATEAVRQLNAGRVVRLGKERNTYLAEKKNGEFWLRRVKKG